MYLWVFTACVLGEGVEERDAFVVGWSFFHILLNCGPEEKKNSSSCFSLFADRSFLLSLSGRLASFPSSLHFRFFLPKKHILMKISKIFRFGNYEPP